MSEEIENVKSRLHGELQKYIDGKSEFLPYYPGMSILSSSLYKEQLKELLRVLEEENVANAKSFEMYLETIIINMQTKAKKYKPSVYFDDENVKDIDHQGLTIPFYFDEKRAVYVLLGILESHEVS